MIKTYTLPMTTNRKAILLSALVLPGLGQINLKRKKRGLAIILIVLFSLYKVMSIATEKANEIVSNMMSQGGVVDMQAITQAAARSTEGTAYDLYIWLLIACWIISIIDILLFTKQT